MMRKIFFLDGVVEQPSNTLQTKTMGAIGAIPLVNKVASEPTCSLEKGLIASHLKNTKDAVDGTGLLFCTTCRFLVCETCADKEHQEHNVKFSHEASLSIVRGFAEEHNKVLE